MDKECMELENIKQNVGSFIHFNSLGEEKNCKFILNHDIEGEFNIKKKFVLKCDCSTKFNNNSLDEEIV